MIHAIHFTAHLHVLYCYPDAALPGDEFLFEKVPLNRHTSAVATNNNTQEYEVSYHVDWPLDIREVCV